MEEKSKSVVEEKTKAVEEKKARPVKASSSSKGPNGLNANQEAFCEAYVKQPLPRNATLAYMEVYKGCKDERSAYSGASALLSQPKIQARITALNSEFTARHFISRDNVLAGFWRVYQQCINAEPVLDAKGRPVITKITVNGPDGTETQELRGVWKFDSKGANAALQSIARYLGLFNADTSGAPNVSVSVEVANVRDLITQEMSRLHSMGADGARAELSDGNICRGHNEQKVINNSSEASIDSEETRKSQ